MGGCHVVDQSGGAWLSVSTIGGESLSRVPSMGWLCYKGGVVGKGVVESDLEKEPRSPDQCHV